MGRVTLPSGQRYYNWPGLDGEGRKITERYWSVTTIIDGGIPKQQFLTKWAARLVAEFALDNLPAVHALLDAAKSVEWLPIPVAQVEHLIGEAEKQAGQVDPRKLAHLIDICRMESVDPMKEVSQKDAAVKLLKEAPQSTKERAALTGSEIHEAIECWMLDQPFPGVSDHAKPWMDGFREFFVRFRPEVLQVEASVFNRSRKYAGTLDGIFEFEASRIEPLFELLRIEPKEKLRLLVDAKTGKGKRRKKSLGAIYPEAALQMSAYRHAEFIGGPDHMEYPMLEVDGAVAIHIHPDLKLGFEVVPIRTDEEVHRAFLYAREVFRWGEETSKTVIGEPLPVPEPPDDGVVAVVPVDPDPDPEPEAPETPPEDSRSTKQIMADLKESVEKVKKERAEEKAKERHLEPVG